MAFRNSIEAFLHAVKEGHGPDMQVVCRIGLGANGMKHCTVQVTGDSFGYSIEAYGDEAEELCEKASRYARASLLAVSSTGRANNSSSRMAL
ncbi:hypothetical protein [Nitrososphaera sp.]|uniref:hypothetical protein n=1 Tax=Nitrososphaera sp. TaxID=1971748 RepID=UPI00307DC3DA